jgi:hypothetical protein
MSQYDFGIIDPYVDDGVTLANMLNSWRDAVHSWHRGAARPSYAVPGMLWVNDNGGPTNWIVNVYLGPAIGDKALWNYNTTTGAVAIAAGISLPGGPFLPLAGGALTGPLSAQLTVDTQLGAADTPGTFITNVPGLGYVRVANSNLGNAASAGLSFDLASVPNAYAQLFVQKNTGNPFVQLALGVGITDGFYLPPLTKGTAPPAADNSNRIPTTAWVRANGGQVAARCQFGPTGAIVSSRGVTSVTKTGTGAYRVVLSAAAGAPFATVNDYTVMVMADTPNGALVYGIANRTTTGFDIGANNVLSGPGAQDYPTQFIVCI